MQKRRIGRRIAGEKYPAAGDLGCLAIPTGTPFSARIMPEYHPAPGATGAAAILLFAVARVAQAMISGLFAAFSRFTRAT